MVLFLAVVIWLVIVEVRISQKAAASLLRIYCSVSLLIGLVGMQGCDFRVWRLTKTRVDAFVLSALAGIGRITFILVVALGLSTFLTIFMPIGFGPLEPNRFAQCRNNMKVLSVAMRADIEANNGQWPRSSAGSVPVSWRVSFLPYFDEASLRRNYDESRPWDDGKNLPVAQKRPGSLTCPASVLTTDDQKRWLTSYVMVTGPGTLAPGDREIRQADIRDGLANTAMFVEAVGLNIVWTEPRDADVSRTPIGINLKGQGKTDSPGLMSSYHSSGRAQMVLADGSVRTVNEDIDPQVLKSLTTIAGSEPLPPDW
jgi:hypothetical protein